MTQFKDHDGIVTKVDVVGWLISGPHQDDHAPSPDVLVPKGAKGVIMLIHGPVGAPDAFMVEFYLENMKGYAMANIKPADLMLNERPR